MSRPRTSGLRDMNLPTIADLRGVVDEACRYCEDAEGWADDAHAAVRVARWIILGELLLGLVQVAMLVAGGVILVTR